MVSILLIYGNYQCSLKYEILGKKDVEEYRNMNRNWDCGREDKTFSILAH
jgi:hypothetical protein